MAKEVKVSWGKNLSETEMLFLVKNEFQGRGYGNYLDELSIVLRCKQIAEEENGITATRVREEIVNATMRKKVAQRILSLYDSHMMRHVVISRCPVCDNVQEDEELPLDTSESYQCDACGLRMEFDDLNATFHASLDQFQWKLKPDELLKMELVNALENHLKKVMNCYKLIMTLEPSAQKTEQAKLEKLKKETVVGFYYNENLKL